MPRRVLRFESVAYRYPDARSAALDHVELSLVEGEFVLLVGTSGSGKSTLLRATSALVPHFHGGEFAGRVTVCGRDTRTAGPAGIAEVAATVFQDPESQVVMNTVAAELALALENRGVTELELARACEETALALGIAELLERPVATLSGGELQRVALGAALVGAPRLLLLDEPTSQLDPVAGDELIAQLRRLNEEWGTAIVLAEQRVERCLAAADRVIALEQGAIAFDGRPREFVAWASEHAPALTPPAARMFALAGRRPLPVGVKDARATLPGDLGPYREEVVRERPARRSRFRRKREDDVALELSRLWVEFGDGTGAGVAALHGVDLAVARSETVALVGRNGAGKSTLLRAAAGLVHPSRGRIRTSGEVALVVQSPSDYFLRERVRDELLPALAEEALEELDLAHVADAHPRDLSGGERQRLALAIVLAGRGIAGGKPPAVIALDEPTRGLDRAQKEELAARIRSLAVVGAAVVTATHDVEFAARAADRCVLLGRGRVLADGPVRELLSGGRYFATEVARVLGAQAKAILAEEGAQLLRAHATSSVAAELAEMSAP